MRSRASRRAVATSSCSVPRAPSVVPSSRLPAWAASAFASSPSRRACPTARERSLIRARISSRRCVSDRCRASRAAASSRSAVTDGSPRRARPARTASRSVRRARTSSTAGDGSRVIAGASARFPSVVEVGAVVVSDLRVRFGELLAVDGVSFSVDSGETVVVLGPNGAGKTTTIETVEGHRRPTSGSVRVLGLDPVGDARALRPRVGVMPQDGGVYPGIRPLEALRLFASYYPHPADPTELLARVGLASRARTPWRRLSGGEQQRLSLALALVGRPEVAFLDEPTAGVDVDGRRSVRELIGRLHDDGVTVVVTTHDLDEAERLADRIVILDRGRVVADGTAAELRTAADVDDIAFAAEPGLDVAALGGVLGAPVTEVAPGEYVAAAAPTPSNVATVTGWLAEHGVSLGELRGSRRRLEDVFLRLTGGGAERDER